jgi:hypothetical protein
VLSCSSQEEYYEDYYAEDCIIGADGKVQLDNSTASCDLKIEGVDKQVRRASWDRSWWPAVPHSTTDPQQ